MKEKLKQLGFKEYTSHLPPAIVPNLNGKRYAVIHPNGVKYIEIPIDINIDDIFLFYSKPKIEHNDKEETFSVPSNTSLKDYIVKLSKGNFTCNCKGFDFKHTCSHIELVKSGKLFEYKSNFKRIKISTGKGFKIVMYNKLLDEYVCSCAGYIKKGTCIHIDKAKEL